MARSRAQRWMRIWMLIMGVMFAGRCAEQARPYLAQIMQPGASASASAPVPERASDRRRLRIASWNLEWLDEPARGVVQRASEDFERLSVYAERLDPDVVAVQEVASAEALAQVFDPEQFVFHLTDSKLRQRAGFVVRRSVAFTAQPDLRELAVDQLRPGAVIRVQTAAGPLVLLSLHLKAACARGPLDLADPDCRKLAAQLPVLERWIDERARAGEAFAVLGDFNRVFDASDPLWKELDDGDPSTLRLARAGLGKPSSCKGRYRDFVDHLWFGGPAAGWIASDTFAELRYDASDRARHQKLSDHCPIVVGLELPVSEHAP